MLMVFGSTIRLSIWSKAERRRCRMRIYFYAQGLPFHEEKVWGGRRLAILAHVNIRHGDHDENFLSWCHNSCYRLPLPTLAAERPRRFWIFKCNRETSDGGMGKGDKTTGETFLPVSRWVRWEGLFGSASLFLYTLLNLCSTEGVEWRRMLA